MCRCPLLAEVDLMKFSHDLESVGLYTLALDTILAMAESDRRNSRVKVSTECSTVSYTNTF